jgi:hypothetical protein
MTISRVNHPKPLKKLWKLNKHGIKNTKKRKKINHLNSYNLKIKTLYNQNKFLTRMIPMMSQLIFNKISDITIVIQDYGMKQLTNKLWKWKIKWKSLKICNSLRKKQKKTQKEKQQKKFREEKHLKKNKKKRTDHNLPAKIHQLYWKRTTELST